MDKTYLYDCYDAFLQPLGIFFCRDCEELFKVCPKVKYILCQDFIQGSCYKEVSPTGVGYIVKRYGDYEIY